MDDDARDQGARGPEGPLRDYIIATQIIIVRDHYNK